MITIFHTFYNQHEILAKHFIAWDNHPRGMFTYLIIDDCSPKIISQPYPPVNLRIARIQQDIPWNIAGARNLGFHVSSTDWVLGADIDHVVTPEAATKILSLDLSNPKVVYTFKRVSDDDGKIGCPASINILINKRLFSQIGGYDEDFSGNYGKEETFFRHCLQWHSVKIVRCDNFFLKWYPRLGATRGLIRDKTINNVKFMNKMIALKNGVYRNGPTLRFGWEVIFGNQTNEN